MKPPVYRFIFCLLMLSSMVDCMWSKGTKDSLLIYRVFDYAASVGMQQRDSCSYAYMKYTICCDRRNFVLLTVPTMYSVAHGDKREYVGEVYSRFRELADGRIETTKLLETTTVPHRRKTLPTLSKYLTPKMYDITMIDDYLLSPFHRDNKVFYRYRETVMYGGMTRITFKPRLDNTQLVKGSALIDSNSGKIISAEFEGEYDMVRFHLSVTMCKEEGKRLLPDRCELRAKFKFLGNLVRSKYEVCYNLPELLSDSITQREDTVLMEKIRPISLNASEKFIYQHHWKEQRARDSVRVVQRTRKKRWWDVVGESMVNRTRSNFGDKNQGYLRISPILNPLYMGYSKRKGLYYRFDVRSSYRLGGQRELSARYKAGYSFKQHQFYFTFPIKFYYDRQHNNYLLFEMGSGNRISHPSMTGQVKIESVGGKDEEIRDRVDFKDFYWKLTNNHTFSDRFGVEGGLIFHRRSSIDKSEFKQLGIPYVYKSTAAALEFRCSPMGQKSPVFTLDYERSIKGFLKSNTGYERWEMDGQYIHRLHRLQSYSMRAGVGFYTYKDRDAYFLDYTNFRERTIPGGWNDDWTGEFELLSRKWYNASNYYVRGNLTYESPLLLLSWIPFVGHFMEMERIYVSVLSVTHLHPYVECGYGFTTRLFSLGFFVANKNGAFEGVGCKIGLELFRDW